MDYGAVFTSVVALLVVLGLMLAVSHFLNKYGAEKLAQRFQKQGKRLKVNEVLVLDTKHKLLLVQQDDKEHLLLLGSQGGSQIIESHALVAIQQQARMP